MGRRRARPGPEGRERWLLSYADFITLLFAVFVVLFASSKADEVKEKHVAASLRRAFGSGGAVGGMQVFGDRAPQVVQQEALNIAPPNAFGPRDPQSDPANKWMPSMQSLHQALSTEIGEGKVEIHLDGRGLVVSLRQTALFSGGGSDILPGSSDILAKIAATLRTLPNSIQFEGHTDSLPISNSRYRDNWELSAGRSIAMMERFRTEYGLARARLSIAGYAETSPLASNDTPEGRERNRRVELVILNQPSPAGR